MRDYVQRLERDEDDGSDHDGSDHDGSPIDEASLPSGDALAAEFERYLREQRDE